MRRMMCLVTLLAAVAGAVAVWVQYRVPTGGPAALQAAESCPANKPNLTLWVPDEELRVWDPVNPNVNPVPWQVFSGHLAHRAGRPGGHGRTAVDNPN